MVHIPVFWLEAPEEWGRKCILLVYTDPAYCLYEFSGAAIKDHKLGGLKQQTIIVSQFQRLKVSNHGAIRALLPLRSLERTPCVSRAFRCWARPSAFLGLQPHHPVICVYLHKAPFPLCASVFICRSHLHVCVYLCISFPFLIRAPVILEKVSTFFHYDLVLICILIISTRCYFQIKPHSQIPKVRAATFIYLWDTVKFTTLPNPQ